MVLTPLQLRTARVRNTVCQLLLVIALGALNGVHARAPEAGMALVAARDTGGVFKRSIVYMLSHDADGSLGLIVNRPTRASLTDLLPKLAEIEARDHRVRYGGPVGLQALKFLIRRAVNPGDAVRVSSDLFASGSPELLESLLRHDVDPAALRVFIGYAGWAPGQLGQELGRDAWYVVPLSTQEIFDADTDMWDRLIEELDPPGIQTELHPLSGPRLVGWARQRRAGAQDPDSAADFVR